MDNAIEKKNIKIFEKICRSADWDFHQKIFQHAIRAENYECTIDFKCVTEAALKLSMLVVVNIIHFNTSHTKNLPSFSFNCF